MIIIKCQDFLGKGKCNYIARGKDNQEAVEHTLQHLRYYHPQYLRSMSTGDRLQLRNRLKKISY